MKKFVAMLLAVVLMGALAAGCGQTPAEETALPSPEATAAENTAESETTPEPQKLKIVTTIFPEYPRRQG